MYWVHFSVQLVHFRSCGPLGYITEMQWLRRPDKCDFELQPLTSLHSHKEQNFDVDSLQEVYCCQTFFLINSTNYVLFVTKVQELFTCSLSMSECINFLIIKLSYSLKFNKVLSLLFSFVNFNTIIRGQMYTKTFITVVFQSRWCTNATVVFNSIPRN